MCCVCSGNLKADLEVARIKVDTLQLKKNIAESKVCFIFVCMHDWFCKNLPQFFRPLTVSGYVIAICILVDK